MDQAPVIPLPSSSRDARWFLFTLVGAALAIGIAGIVLNARDIEPNPRALELWSFVYVWIVLVWIDLDSRGRANVQRPFDYLFLVYLIWPFYLPYYLIRTRGARGVLGVVAFGALYCFSEFPELFIL